jgi:DNA-binding FadR family transcriptional regulator
MERLKKVNLSEALYKQRLAMINNRELKPGDKLALEPELCNLLGRPGGRRSPSEYSQNL